MFDAGHRLSLVIQFLQKYLSQASQYFQTEVLPQVGHGFGIITSIIIFILGMLCKRLLKNSKTFQTSNQNHLLPLCLFYPHSHCGV
jgi:hypothetical protein